MDRVITVFAAAVLLVTTCAFVNSTTADVALDNSSEDIRDLFPPRVLPVKPARTKVTEDHMPDVMYLKLRDESVARPVVGRLITDSPEEQTAIATVSDILGKGSIAPMIDRDPEIMRQEHIAATRNLGRNIADISRWYTVRFPDSTRKTLEETIDNLNALEIVEMALPAPMGTAPPPTPTCTWPQNCETQAKQGYLYSENATHGINATAVWNSMGISGQGVRIADIEANLSNTNTDLPSITFLNSNNQSLPNGSPAHGTGILGILGAKRQGQGTTGIAYGSTLYFISHEANNNVCTKLDLAKNALNPGDIILIEMQWHVTTQQAGDFAPIEIQQFNYDCIVTTVGLNYVVVATAGNGNVNLDSLNLAHNPFSEANDSGAIIVGAGSPTTHNKTTGGPGTASSYGSRVNVQGWGFDVLTTSPNQTFGTSSGTSSAGAIVAGAAALVQSAYKAAKGQIASPWHIRGALILTGTPQGAASLSTKIGPLPDAYAAAQMLISTKAVPTNFNIQSGFCWGQGDATWGSPGSGAFTYQLQGSTSLSFAPGTTWFEYIGTGHWAFINVPQTSYFRVRACKNGGCGPYSPLKTQIRYSICH